MFENLSNDMRWWLANGPWYAVLVTDADVDDDFDMHCMWDGIT